MRILSFDQSTALTGYAIFEFETDNHYSNLIKYGLLDCRKNKTNQLNNSVGIEAMMRKICAVIHTAQPHIVVIEDTILQTNAVTLKELAKVQGAIMFYCDLYNIDLSISYPTHWRKFVGIKRTKGMKRPELKKAAQDLVLDKFNVQVSEDIADAICIGMAYIEENFNNKE